MGPGLFAIFTQFRAWILGQNWSQGLPVVWSRHTSVSSLVKADADPEVQACVSAWKRGSDALLVTVIDLLR